LSGLKKSIHAIPFWKIETKTIKTVQTHANNVRQQLDKQSAAVDTLGRREA